MRTISFLFGILLFIVVVQVQAQMPARNPDDGPDTSEVSAPSAEQRCIQCGSQFLCSSLVAEWGDGHGAVKSAAEAQRRYFFATEVAANCAKATEEVIRRYPHFKLDPSPENADKSIKDPRNASTGARAKEYKYHVYTVDELKKGFNGTSFDFNSYVKFLKPTEKGTEAVQDLSKSFKDFKSGEQNHLVSFQSWRPTAGRKNRNERLAQSNDLRDVNAGLKRSSTPVAVGDAAPVPLRKAAPPTVGIPQPGARPTIKGAGDPVVADVTASAPAQQERKSVDQAAAKIVQENRQSPGVEANDPNPAPYDNLAGLSPKEQALMRRAGTQDGESSAPPAKINVDPIEETPEAPTAVPEGDQADIQQDPQVTVEELKPNPPTAKKKTKHAQPKKGSAQTTARQQRKHLQRAPLPKQAAAPAAVAPKVASVEPPPAAPASVAVVAAATVPKGVPVAQARPQQQVAPADLPVVTAVAPVVAVASKQAAPDPKVKDIKAFGDWCGKTLTEKKAAEECVVNYWNQVVGAHCVQSGKCTINSVQECVAHINQFKAAIDEKSGKNLDAFKAAFSKKDDPLLLQKQVTETVDDVCGDAVKMVRRSNEATKGLAPFKTALNQLCDNKTYVRDVRYPNDKTPQNPFTNRATALLYFRRVKDLGKQFNEFGNQNQPEKAAAALLKKKLDGALSKQDAYSKASAEKVDVSAFPEPSRSAAEFLAQQATNNCIRFDAKEFRNQISQAPPTGQQHAVYYPALAKDTDAKVMAGYEAVVDLLNPESKPAPAAQASGNTPKPRTGAH